jgi:PQQ-dependent catabolism-associated CXXCW motif protein
MGAGALDTAKGEAFRARLRTLTGGDMTKPIVVYCHHACWLSWNAAKRAIADGYRRVIWYPDGIEGWTQAGKPLEQSKG